MGWGGYSIYDGDGTQTLHYDHLKWAGVSKDDDEIMEWLLASGTKIPKERIPIFLDGLPKILKKMPKKIVGKTSSSVEDEDRAIEWQMLMALFIDNKLPIPKIVYKMGVEATNYLMKDHAADFDCPSKRRAVLIKFLKKAEALRG